MSNPFRNSGTPSLNDMAMPLEARAQAQAGTSPAGPNVLSYDPVSKTGSPNVNVLLDEIFKTVRQHLDQRDKQMIEAVADEFAPLIKRIEALERGIDTQRTEVQDAIRYAAAGFLGETGADDDDITMESLERQHALHKKTMAGRPKGDFS